MIENQIEALLQAKFQEEEFQDCFLIEISFHKNKLEVFIDSDSGVTFQKCQQISRYLEGAIDENEWLGDKYVLEVSSAGISRPLQLKRQYLKNIGRKLEVTPLEGKAQKGILSAVQDDSIVLTQKIKEKEGKRNVHKTVETVFPLATIKKAVVKVSF